MACDLYHQTSRLTQSSLDLGLTDIKTATEVSTGDTERAELRRLAFEIARSNGYTETYRRRRLAQRSVTRVHTSSMNKLPLCIPFVSDEMSMAIKQCIRRAQLEDDVMLVNIPHSNIKKQLVRNRLYDAECTSESCIVCPYGKLGDCAKQGVVYQLECLTCNATYIGETGRALCIRVKEHLASKRKGTLTSPLGRHKLEAHGGDDFDVRCIILACETEITARKALEAAWIYTGNPAMNNKNECVLIRGELLPFVSLCELSVAHIRPDSLTHSQ